MNEEDRRAYVVRRAYELARTGKYPYWLSIEAVLRFQEGFPEAREWLDDRFLRDDLDRVCSWAREAKKA